jgi:hypothetical protein
MHPEMMMALANEIETERRRERQRIEQRSLAHADRLSDAGGPVLASVLVRRLFAGLSLRLRVS